MDPNSKDGRLSGKSWFQCSAPRPRPQEVEGHYQAGSVCEETLDGISAQEWRHLCKALGNREVVGWSQLCAPPAFLKTLKGITVYTV